MPNMRLPRQWMKWLARLLVLAVVADSAWTAAHIWRGGAYLPPVQRADAAIVLGAAVWRGQPSPVFAARINYALDLLRNGTIDHIIFTGGIGGGDDIAEATAAAHYALAQGIDATALRCETTSHTTWQNLVAATAIMQQEQWSRSIIVSDPLHLYRATMMANDLPMQTQPGPTPYTRYRTLRSQMPFLLRELFFVYQYRLQRWMSGPHIDLPVLATTLCPAAEMRAKSTYAQNQRARLGGAPPLQ